jgi:hypothetical protein
VLYRLLVDLDAVEYLHGLNPAQRRRVLEHFQRLREFPTNLSLAERPDAEGKTLHISFFEDLSIYFWLDSADRHVKVVRIEAKD